ncbi:MAG: YidC/Oxa1 family membrane protein insertase, partial [Candidatus Promineifilaceae bacterium]
MSFIWQNYIINPLTNLLLILYDVLFDNFFLALVAFTAIVRLAMIPLSLRQQRSMAKTQEMQPQIQAIQKKYRDDPARMQEEFSKIGYNPADSLLGCLPLLLQMPIFFGLYRAIIFVMSSTPQGLYQLSERASARFVDLSGILPIDNSFGWLNLAQPDQLFILPLLVGGSMYLQQKIMAPAPAKKTNKKSGEPDTAASMQQSMQVTMPLMFGFMALQFPSGLSVYFVISNLIGIVQGFIMKRSRENEKAQLAANPRKKPKVIEGEAEEIQQKAKAKPKAKKSKQKSAAVPDNPNSEYSGGLFSTVSLSGRQTDNS